MLFQQKIKSEIQDLSSVGPDTWNSLFDNCNSATSDFEADIDGYNWMDLQTKLLTILIKQDKCSYNFSSVSISRFFPIFSIFPICVLFINLSMSFFLRDHNGNKAYLMLTFVGRTYLKKKDWLYDANRAAHLKGGTHWACLNEKSDNVFNFDSFRVEHITKETQNLIDKKNFLSNNYRI